MSRQERIEILAKSLVTIPSVNERRTAGDGSPFQEAVVAEEMKRSFEENGVPCMIQELEDGRANVFAFVGGQKDKTVILAGHFDTVGVDNYHRLGLDPFNPDALAKAQEADKNGFVFGRGIFDMKSGLAVGMELMAEWNGQKDEFPGSVLFVATCDEENNSYGILNAAEVLLRAKGAIKDDSRLSKQVSELTGGRFLGYEGVINLDYTTERYPGDPEYHVWAGTIGKLLPTIYVRGKETHVGEHFNGFQASSLISRITSSIEGNMQLADTSVPPTALKITDGRTHYDVMTSNVAKAYFNVFSVGRTPVEVTDSLEQVVRGQVDEYIDYVDRNYQEYCRRMNIPYERKDWGGKVKIIRYSELVSFAKETFGEKQLDTLIEQAIDNSQSTDNRERSFAVVEKLMSELKIEGPTVVLFFSPPFYPYIKPDSGRLTQVTNEVAVAVGQEHGIEITPQHFYPYISDMSYLRIEPEVAQDLDGLTREMPVWGRSYYLDLEKIRELNLPVVDVGPYGFGAHQTEERAERKYTFQILPKMVDQIVKRVLAS